MATLLYRLCEKIEKGFAAGHTMLDDEMVGNVQDLADRAGEIKALAMTPPLARGQAMLRDLEAEITRLMVSYESQTGLSISGCVLRHRLGRFKSHVDSVQVQVHL